jgi:hypothetical protein
MCGRCLAPAYAGVWGVPRPPGSKCSVCSAVLGRQQAGIISGMACVWLPGDSAGLGRQQAPAYGHWRGMRLAARLPSHDSKGV